MQIDMGTIDFELLRKQKQGLLKIGSFLHKTDVPDSYEMDDCIDGILGMLDQIQDEAEKQVGKEVVFGKEATEE